MDVISLLQIAKSKGASDLHLIVGSPPSMRVKGSLESLDGVGPLTAEDMSQAFVQITTSQEREHFRKHLELDFGYSLPGVGRLRGNAAQQQGSIGLVMRILPPSIPSIDELELPLVCKQLVMRPRGLVVVTGPTGSGKSTTLAAMIKYLLDNETRQVVTIEDPIEYVYSDPKCSVVQREVGKDTLSFAGALKHVLRQDPDVILVGEMRDFETASSVLTVAETGHLILSTGHAPSTAQAMERIIDLFPPHERHLVQMRLASLLNGVLCQVLVPRANGKGRIAAVEVLMANAPVRNLIREGKVHQLPNVIRTHRDIGMISLDESLVNLYLKQIINGKSLIDFCNDRKEVEKLIGRVGIR